MVQTNIKLGYNSESRHDRDYIFGGPCRPFVGMSIVGCPHFEISPGKNPQGLNIPIHSTYIYICFTMVQTNFKMGYNLERNNDEEYIFGGPCRTFVGLLIVRCPHFEILPGKKSAMFEYPVPYYIHTLYNGANEYQSGL